MPSNSISYDLVGVLRQSDSWQMSVARFLVGVYVIVSAVAPLKYGHELVAGLVLAAAVMASGNPRIPRATLAWTGGLVILGLLGVLSGALRSAPGAASQLTIYVLEPALLGPLFSAVLPPGGGLRFMRWVLDFSLVAVAVVGVLVFMGAPVAFLTGSYNAIDLAGGVVRTNYQGYNSFVFLAPYGLFAAISSAGAAYRSHLRRVGIGAAAVSGLLLSGRHVLYLIVPITVTYGVLAVKFGRSPQSRSRRRMRWVGGSVSAVVGLALLWVALRRIGLTLGGALERALSQVTLSDPSGTRGLESTLLIAQWEKSPLIGQGAGSIVGGYARNPLRPWEFELTYQSVLMQFGLIGFSFLVACGTWVLWRLEKGARREGWEARAVQVGFLGVLLASTTDPYLLTSDGIWMFFLPLAVAGWLGR